jgi:hypothetical protein
MNSFTVLYNEKGEPIGIGRDSFEALRSAGVRRPQAIVLRYSTKVFDARTLLNPAQAGEEAGERHGVAAPLQG